MNDAAVRAKPCIAALNAGRSDLGGGEGWFEGGGLGYNMKPDIKGGLCF